MSQSTSPTLTAQRLADLQASLRDIGPSQTAGIVSGQGNQGTACTANLQGHAGTSGTFLGVARQIGAVGIGGSKPQ